ncbi:EamA family transporter [Halobaculum sp. EA56]|uniref:EamA family transporter n=1 Tax=Halobaculum sp. EA56 TaxID=3421648 RepID=UPI003EB92447
MAVALALLASVLFGVQALLIDRALGADANGSALSVAAVVTAISAATLWGVVLVRHGVPSPPRPALLTPFVVAGVADPGLARALFYEGIDRIGPSVASAVLAASPAVASVLAVFVLGEGLAAVEGLGVLLVVAGVATLQFARPDDGVGDDTAADIDAVRRELLGTSARDTLYPVAATLLLAGAFVVVKLGLQSYGDPLTATAVTQTAALCALVPLSVRSARERGAVRSTVRSPLVATLAGLVVAGGWYAMFASLRVGSVVTVLPIVSTYPLVVVVATYALERTVPRSPRMLGAVVAVVVGAGAVRAA